MVLFYTSSFISLCGQLIFQYGVWTALDVFIVGTASAGVFLVSRFSFLGLASSLFLSPVLCVLPPHTLYGHSIAGSSPCPAVVVALITANCRRLNWCLQSDVPYHLTALLGGFFGGLFRVQVEEGMVTQYRTTELNILLIVVGLAMLLISGALMTNAGITLTPTGRSGVSEKVGGDEQEVQAMLKRIIIPQIDSTDASPQVHHYHIGDAVEIEYGLAGTGSCFKATVVKIGSGGDDNKTVGISIQYECDGACGNFFSSFFFLTFRCSLFSCVSTLRHADWCAGYCVRTWRKA